MKIKIIITVISLSIIGSACQQTEVEPEPRPPLEQLFQNSALQYDEYKVIFEDIVQKAKEMNSGDPQLEKWIIRTLGDEKIMNKRDLPSEEAIQKAEESIEYMNAWKQFAKEKYNVEASDSEVESYIQEHVVIDEDIPQQKAYAEALGITIEQLNFEHDRDLYEQQVLWMNLTSYLEKKYDTKDTTDLLKKYDEEVRKTLK